MSIIDREILALCRDVTERVILPRYQNLASGEVVDKGGPDGGIGGVPDPVTIADTESEEALSEGLARIAPGLAMVGEEACHADKSVYERLSGPCWIIDPIDGTRNFASGKPPFGILLAQADGGITQSGWIYDCLTGRFCAAHRGEGAFVDGEKISAKGTGAEPPIAAISLSFVSAEKRAALIEHVTPHYACVDIPWCAAEQYPRLGLGINDVSIFERALPWDHAAGALWLNEAGGKCARPDDGSEYRVDEWARTGLVGAASPQLWDELTGRLSALPA